MLTERIRLAVQTMNEAYGKSRNPDSDLGGFVLIVDNPGEWFQVVERYRIGNQPPEYIEEVGNDNKCGDNHRYFEVLYLLSSDYGIYVFMNDEVEKLIKCR